MSDLTLRDKLLKSSGILLISSGEMEGATESTSGQSGLVPTPTIEDKDKFLQGDGTWQKPIICNGEQGSGYGVCNTNESIIEKEVSLSSYLLAVGGHISIKFTHAVPASATLNINNNGAKPIFYRNEAIPEGVIGAGDTATLVFDGTNYNFVAKDSSIKLKVW